MLHREGAGRSPPLADRRCLGWHRAVPAGAKPELPGQGARGIADLAINGNATLTDLLHRLFRRRLPGQRAGHVTRQLADQRIGQFLGDLAKPAHEQQQTVVSGAVADDLENLAQHRLVHHDLRGEVDRVLRRCKSRKDLRQPRLGFRGKVGNVQPFADRGIGHQDAGATRHRNHRHPLPGRARLRQQDRGLVGHVGQAFGAPDIILSEYRVIGFVLARQRAGMRGSRRRALTAATGLQRQHRLAPLEGLTRGGAKGGTVAHPLDIEPDHFGLVVFDQVIQTGGQIDIRLVSGGNPRAYAKPRLHRHVEPVGAQGTALGDETVVAPRQASPSHHDR